MTVQVQPSSITYAGTGAQTAFPTTFGFAAATDLTVKQTSAGVTTTKALNVDYTVDGAGNAEPGGTVNMTVAPAGGDTLYIERNTPATQLTDFLTSGPFSANVITRAVDKLTRIVQELLRRVGVLEALGTSLVGNLGTLAGAKVSVDFKTDAVAVENTFPLAVAVANGSTATQCLFGYIEDRDTGAVLDDPSAVQWAPGIGNLITIKRVSGLKPNTNYRMRLTVLQ